MRNLVISCPRTEDSKEITKIYMHMYSCCSDSCCYHGLLCSLFIGLALLPASPFCVYPTHPEGVETQFKGPHPLIYFGLFVA